MATNLVDEMVLLDTGRSLASKLSDTVSALDYGASTTSTATANTTAINAAIAATNGGYVLIPEGVAYTESNIVFADGVTLIVIGAYSTITFLAADYGDTPISRGGIGIKQQNTAGVVLRAVDFGVTAEPFLQVVDLANGDIAATHTKFIEMDEISAPAIPSANKSRLYTRDDGSGNTQLVAQFPTGDPVVVAKQNYSLNLVGTATYDPASLADGAGVSTNVTVTGATLGDIVVTSFSLDLQGITLTSYVSATDTVTVRFQNETGGVLDLASGTLKALVIRNY